MTLKASFIIAAAAAAISAGAASANPIDNTKLTFGYDNFQGENAAGDKIERTGKWARADTSLELGSFAIDLGAAHGDLMEDGAQTTFSVAPKLDFGAGMKLGGFVDYTIADDAKTQHYGATAELESGDMTITGYLGYGVYEGENSNVYGVAADYDLAGAFEIGAFYNAETFESGDMSEMGASIGYNMTAFSIPGKLTATYAIQDAGGDTLDRVGVAFSIPLGQSGEVSTGAPSAHKRSVALAKGFSTAK